PIVSTSFPFSDPVFCACMAKTHINEMLSSCNFFIKIIRKIINAHKSPSSEYLERQAIMIIGKPRLLIGES
ncbi:hypothetical protein, partial [Klebsiella aerogenes]|uniref:hypothetical protein n=1 Tax=Klebsiella aerogenes TaxID=548 RepID=UPI0019546615